MRRKARLFALAEHLRARRTGVTAQALAERFGVTLRTMYRDLDSLREAELPVRADRGRGGGYALDRNYTLPPVNFTAREAAVLVALGRFASHMRLLPFTSTLATALDKVQGALSASAQRELLTHLDSLSFVGVPAAPVPSLVRERVEQAWFEQVPLKIQYESPTGHSQRRIRIEGVVMERSLTLLKALDLDKNEPRQFRLDRIRSAVLDRG